MRTLSSPPTSRLPGCMPRALLAGAWVRHMLPINRTNLWQLITLVDVMTTPQLPPMAPYRRAPPLKNMPLLHCILPCLKLSILGRRSDELYQEMKLNPEASQLNNSALRERYAFLDIFVGMTAGQQQQGPPCFGALVTTHMHIWERWFQSCVPFRTCTINHSSSESKFCRPVH